MRHSCSFVVCMVKEIEGLSDWSNSKVEQDWKDRRKRWKKVTAGEMCMEGMRERGR